MTTTKPSNWPTVMCGLVAGPGASGSVTGGTGGRPDLDRNVDTERHVLPDGDTTVHTVPSSYIGGHGTRWHVQDGAQCDCWPSVRLSRDGQHVTRIVTHHAAEETRGDA